MNSLGHPNNAAESKISAPERSKLLRASAIGWPTSKSLFRLIRVALAIALFGLLVLFYARTNRIVITDYERFDNSLRRVRRLDATLNQDVLKARFRLLEDYDTFGEVLTEFQAAIEDLQVPPGFCDAQARIDLEIGRASCRERV